MTDGGIGQPQSRPTGGEGDVRAALLLRRSLAIIAMVTLVTAWFSETHFNADEHYQVLEFMSYKLGITAAADLPWEFHDRIRSWMQPFLYFLIAKPLIWAGLKDLFDITFILRLVTGLVSLAALTAFATTMLPTFRRDDEKLFFARALPFFGFLPYIFVRTSSETLSAAFFVLGFVLVADSHRTASHGRFIMAGLLCGLAFECRFQSAIFVAGLLAWLAVVARVRLSALASFGAAFAAIAVLAVPIDHWGYGEWCFPAWNYLKVNLLDNVAAQRFGTDPFYAYAYLFPANIFLPILVVLFVGMILAWVRHPRHVVTWVSLPYFLVHCVIAHKEERFLFPLAIFATMAPVLAFAPSGGPWLSSLARLWPYRNGRLVKVIAGLSVAAMTLLAVYPYGFGDHLPMAKYLYRHFPNGLTIYSFDREPWHFYPMYRPVPFRVIRLAGEGALRDRLAKGPIYIVAETLTFPEGVLPDGAHATLLYSELPFAQDARVAAFGTKAMAFDRFIDRKIFGLKIPHFAWLALYRVEPALE